MDNVLSWNREPRCVPRAQKMHCSFASLIFKENFKQLLYTLSTILILRFIAKVVSTFARCCCQRSSSCSSSRASELTLPNVQYILNKTCTQQPAGSYHHSEVHFSATRTKRKAKRTKVTKDSWFRCSRVRFSFFTTFCSVFRNFSSQERGGKRQKAL